MPGFVHVDIEYLPQMPNKKARRYLFVGIYRATRRVCLCIFPYQSELSRTDFLRSLKGAAPMKIVERLTDHGSSFTDRFTRKEEQSSGSTPSTASARYLVSIVV